MKNKKKFDIYDIFATKTFRIVFSIIVAVALWTYVASADAQDTSFTVRNVPVDFIGGDTLGDANLVLTGVDVNSVSFTFTGRRSTVTKLNKSNVTLTVDLSEITRQGRAGIYQLPYEIDFPSGINPNTVSRTASVDYITATVERLVTKTVEITGVNRCSIASGYQSEPMEFSPSTITVSGSEALVSAVDHAQVILDKQDVSRTVQENVAVMLMGSGGQEISPEGLTLSDDTVMVTMPVVMVKEVGLTVNLIYSNSATENNVTYTITPPSVTIAGDADILSDYNQMVIGNIDLTSFTSSTTETMSIPIPNDVDNLSGESVATVKVEVLEMSTARVSATNIMTRNAPAGHAVEIITQSLDVLLRGPEDTLENVTADNIRIVADLSEAGGVTGTMSVSAKVYIDGFSDVDAIGVYKVSVEIT